MSQNGGDFVLLDTCTTSIIGEPDEITTTTLEVGTGIETKTTTKGGVVVAQSSTSSVNWNTNVPGSWNASQYTNPGNYTVTTPNFTLGPMTSGGTVTITTSDNEPFDLSDLEPLLKYIGLCVACGDEAEVLLCSPCGIAVRELGRKRLSEYMSEIEKELG